MGESSRSVSDEATDDVFVPAAGTAAGTGRGREDVTGEEFGCGCGFPVSVARDSSKWRAPALSRISVFRVDVGSDKGL